MLHQWVVLFLTTAIAASSVIFEDCGSAYELERVNIDGCSTRLPCYVTLGDKTPVSVEFYAKGFTSFRLEQDVVININHVNTETSVIPAPCEIVSCPVQSNKMASFTSNMLVPTNMALNRQGYLRWRVYNEENRQVLCYSVLVETQSQLQKMLRQKNNLTNNEESISSTDRLKSLN